MEESFVPMSLTRDRAGGEMGEEHGQDCVLETACCLWCANLCGAPRTTDNGWAEEVVWPPALPEETSLANLSLVTQSGKLAPVGFGRAALMSSAGENAECPRFREEKDLPHKITAGPSHRRLWRGAWATFVSDTCSVASKLAHPGHMGA